MAFRGSVTMRTDHRQGKMTERVLVRSDGRTLARPALRAAYLSNQLPYPPHSGGQLRAWEWLRRLSEHVEMHFFAVTDHFSRDASWCDVVLRHARSVVLAEAVPEPADAPPPGVPDRLWRYRCPAMRDTIATHLRNVSLDVIHVEGFFLMRHVPTEPRAAIMLFADNVEHDLERQRGSVLDAGAAASGSRWRAVRDEELAAWQRAHLCGAVSHEDVEHMQRLVPGLAVRQVAPGCDHMGALRRSTGPPEPGRSPRALFVGNYDWAPSRDAAQFLLDEVWPLVSAAVPGAELVLAGAGSSDALSRAASGVPAVTVTGPLESLAPVLEAASVMVCPLRFGSGVKSKVLEALWAGCPIVSTPVGLQGLPPEVREAIVVAETGPDLARETASLLRSADRRSEASARVRQVRALLPTWQESTSKILDVWKETVRAGRG